MKALIFAAMLSLSAVSFADTTIEAEQTGSELNILDLVVGIKQTYSETSGLQAKVIELLAGDGMNATRMVLAINTGYFDSKVFELDEMMVEVKRITFLAKDLIVINFTQDSFDENDNQVLVNRSLTIKVQRNADNTLADSIVILKK